MPTQEDYDSLKKEVEDLKALVQSFFDNATMPFELGTAMQARLNVDDGVSSGHTDSSITAGSKTTVVSATSVAKPMDGFIRFTFRGLSFDVPYYI